jgi:hypothetical protein
MSSFIYQRTRYKLFRMFIKAKYKTVFALFKYLKQGRNCFQPLRANKYKNKWIRFKEIRIFLNIFETFLFQEELVVKLCVISVFKL